MTPTLHKNQVHCCGVMQRWDCSSLVRAFACRGRLRNLLEDCWAVASLLRNNHTAINLQTFTSSWVVGVFSRVANAPFAVFFPPRIDFFRRPACLGLIMKNRVKSVFFEAINNISNFNVFNIIKLTLHYSVHTRTAGEKLRISDEAERVNGFISSYKNIVGHMHNLIVSNANWRNWWNKG